MRVVVVELVTVHKESPNCGWVWLYSRKIRAKKIVILVQHICVYSQQKMYACTQQTGNILD